MKKNEPTREVVCFADIKKIIPIGNHLILEITGANLQLLQDVNYLKKIMIKAAEKAGATIVNTIFCDNDSQGIIGVVVVAESHLSIHTFPKEKSAAVDIFFCGDRMNTDLACQIITSGLRGKKAQEKLIIRGPLKGDSNSA